MSGWHTGLWLSSMPIPAGAELGIEETHKAAGEAAEVYLTWNGIPKVRGRTGARYRHMHLISLSCDHRWGPAVESLRPGDELVLHSTHFDGFYIPAGQTAVQLLRFPVPCEPVPRKPHGFHVLAHAGNSTTLVPIAVAGRTVSIAAPAPYDVVGQYRAIRPVTVVSIDPGAAKEIQGRQSWGLELVDRMVPEDWTP